MLNDESLGSDGMVETVGSQIGANRVTVGICRNGTVVQGKFRVRSKNRDRSGSIGKVTKYDVRSKSRNRSGSVGKVQGQEYEQGQEKYCSIGK